MPGPPATLNAFQRDFAGEVRRCDDMERKLRYLLDEVTKAKF
jgi:V-type H+-transporting ATPase subunit a